MRFLGLLPGLCMLTTAALLDVQFPHLLVPISSFSPDRSIGTQPTGEVSNHVYTLVSFDVPGANAAETCRIGFNVNNSPAKNAPREFGGEVPYTFDVFTVKSPINKDFDSWNRHPEAGNWVATVSIDEKYNVKVEGGWVGCKKWNVNQFILKPKGDRKVRVWWYELDYGWDVGGPNGITLELHAWH